MNVIRTPIRVRHQTKLRLVQVARVESLSPRMRRITLAGDALEGFTTAAADDHVKLFFPAPGEERPILPDLAAGGPQPGAVRPLARDYTPRRYNAATQELVIEFVIHGDGPASLWAEQACPGQWLGVGGPRGSFLTPDNYGTYLLAGDETALPAIARALEEMQAGLRVFAVIEVEDAAEERYLPTAAKASITWVHRNGVAPGTSNLLLDAIREITLPAGDTHVWLAGEIETARQIRHHLTEIGLPRADIRAAGYWRHGVAGAHTRLDD